MGKISSFAFSDGDIHLAVTFFSCVTLIYKLEGKSGFDSDTDNEENCIDAMALRFFDSVFCGLVGATFAYESEQETAFTRLVPPRASSATVFPLAGASLTTFSSDSPFRLLQLAIRGQSLLQFDFERGGEVQPSATHSISAPSLTPSKKR
jgi:hypothetical protein